MTLVIGLTGGIASGKSTIAQLLGEKGIEIIDADIEARLAVEKGQEAYNKIVASFGEEILNEDGSINREKLGAIIFHNEKYRQQLNEIVHPAVRKQMIKKRDAAINAGAKVVVLDIPLLFESQLTNLVNKTLVVYVDEKIQLERLMKRNNLLKEDALARIKSQMPLKEKVNLADEVINNNGTIENSERELNKVLKRWKIVTE